MYPLIWRFLPSLDPQVDLFFVRDLDSQISQREVDAVKEFLISGRVYYFSLTYTFSNGHYLGISWNEGSSEP